MTGFTNFCENGQYLGIFGEKVTHLDGTPPPRPWVWCNTEHEGDQFKVNMGRKN